MSDKKVFREIFNFFTKYRDLLGNMDELAYWASAAEEMGKIGAELGGTDFVTDLFVAVYTELSRRADERKAQG